MEVAFRRDLLAIIMKRIKSTVTYKVPTWNFCNSDKLSHIGTLTGATCQFCVKQKGAHRCMLYNESLTTSGAHINKLQSCAQATAGVNSEIIADVVEATPVVAPDQIIKYAIDTYVKTVRELVTQGYPQPMAEQVAKQYTLGQGM